MVWVGSLRARITVSMLVLASSSILVFAFGMYLVNEGLQNSPLPPATSATWWSQTLVAA